MIKSICGVAILYVGAFMVGLNVSQGISESIKNSSWIYPVALVFCFVGGFLCRGRSK